uniref:Transporter n=1 Tax=Plectus sambesii TaxID=2011161 RepID=A0A914XJA4_9BILA
MKFVRSLFGRRESRSNCQLSSPAPQPTKQTNGQLEEMDRKASVHAVEEEQRDQWSGQMDFLMSLVAYAVGLGNVWRFPYLCFKNGGGSFLIAYFVFWALGTVPIFIMEVTTGQYLQRGGIEVWNVCPIFKGVGIGNVVISFICCCYYCVIVTWALYYMIQSFSDTFPWETCGNYWNNDNCITGKENSSTLAEIRRSLSLQNLSTESSVEQYWERRVLQQTAEIGDLGGIQWELFGLSVIAWLVIYFALWRGITQARKFVYICALSPYAILLVLLVRGVTLPGAGTGLYFLFTPNMTKLTEITVWKDAGTQVFYSYGVGFGTLIALGSHNKYNQNCVRDALCLCFINTSTSLLAGSVVFSILGYMSFIAEKDVADIVKPGVGLAFLAYPEVASSLPLKQLWSVLFFLMLAILGIDSQVCMLEGLITALEDKFPIILGRYKKFSLAILCLILFLLSTPMITYAGTYWLTLIDAYGASGIALLFVVFFEVIGLAWGFGVHRIAFAMEDMIGYKPKVFWSVVWKYTAPAITLVLFFMCIFKYQPLTYPNGTEYPTWAGVFGIFLSLASMVVIPGFAIYFLLTAPDDRLIDRVKRGLRNTMNLKGVQQQARLDTEVKELQPLAD